MSGRRPEQQPRYLGVPDHLQESKPSSLLVSFWREQIVNPEFRAGNLNILLGVGVFTAGVVAVRNFGGILVPGF